MYESTSKSIRTYFWCVAWLISTLLCKTKAYCISSVHHHLNNLCWRYQKNVLLFALSKVAFCKINTWSTSSDYSSYNSTLCAIVHYGQLCDLSVQIRNYFVISNTTSFAKSSITSLFDVNMTLLRCSESTSMSVIRMGVGNILTVTLIAQ